MLTALGAFLDYSTRVSREVEALTQLHAEEVRSSEERHQNARAVMEADYDRELDAESTRIDRAIGILIGQL
ncbi:MAG: hypothetical protein OXU69_00350 [Gemmatimonadota bacterium]|nr:hypothetical protein [Gemmatimonadota bacterium]MDE2983128.1 hypothetical protein [Gemmatimonadota bacterium]